MFKRVCSDDTSQGNDGRRRLGAPCIFGISMVAAVGFLLLLLIAWFAAKICKKRLAASKQARVALAPEQTNYTEWQDNDHFPGCMRPLFSRSQPTSTSRPKKLVKKQKNIWHDMDFADRLEAIKAIPRPAHCLVMHETPNQKLPKSKTNQSPKKVSFDLTPMAESEPKADDVGEGPHLGVEQPAKDEYDPNRYLVKTDRGYVQRIPPYPHARLASGRILPARIQIPTDEMYRLADAPENDDPAHPAPRRMEAIPIERPTLAEWNAPHENSQLHKKESKRRSRLETCSSPELRSTSPDSKSIIVEIAGLGQSKEQEVEPAEADEGDGDADEPFPGMHATTTAHNCFIIKAIPNKKPGPPTTRDSQARYLHERRGARPLNLLQVPPGGSADCRASARQKLDKVTAKLTPWQLSPYVAQAKLERLHYDIRKRMGKPLPKDYDFPRQLGNCPKKFPDLYEELKVVKPTSASMYMDSPATLGTYTVYRDKALAAERRKGFVPTIADIERWMKDEEEVSKATKRRHRGMALARLEQPRRPFSEEYAEALEMHKIFVKG